MYFKRIDIHGFKSFADPVSVEFHKGITCVVGPNGSGKSNISDALRWVLGEQSPKTLRGGKMEEVIFAGTVSRKSKGMAEVTLLIDNSTRMLSIDFSEVAITRKMYRSGESEYFINNNQCRLKDIRELIMDTGIGVDGYSIIGQGKISDIIGNKTESRREIFEEAAGIVKYRSKKSEAERKLENTAGNLDRVNDITFEMEGRIDTLKEDSIKAKEYISLREKYKTLEINITLKNIENLQLKNEYFKDDIIEMQGSIEENQGLKTTIDDDILNNRKEIEEIDETIRITNAQLIEATNELSLMTSSRDVSEERLLSIQKDKERLKNEILEIDQKMISQIAEKEDVVAKDDAISTEISEKTTLLNAKIKDSDLLIKKIEDINNDIENYKNQRFSLSSVHSSKLAEIQSLISIKNTLERRKNQLQTEMSEHDESITHVKDGFEENLQKNEKLKEKVEKGKSDKNSLQLLHNTLITEVKAKEKEIAELILSKNELAARKRALDEMEQSYEGYNYAVKFLMQNAKKEGSSAGGLSGIEGIVAELIDVPKGFEIAIEIALGQALQNIICKRDDDAKKAISLLKENRAGRLTFLPIESVNNTRNPEFKRFEGEHGVKGIGVDCIEFDIKFSGIFEYLLGRVIIVDNIDTALRLSKGKSFGLRFVTLEGDVVNQSGAITGGASKSQSTNILSKKAESKELSAKLIFLAEKELSLKKELFSIEDKIEKCLGDLDSESERLRDVEHQLISSNNQLQVSENDFKRAEENKSKQDREIASISQENASTDSMIEKLKEDVKSFDTDIINNEENTEKLQGDVDVLKVDSIRISEEVTEFKMNLSAIESEKNSVYLLLTKVNEYIDGLNSDKSQRENSFSEFQKAEDLIKGNMSEYKGDVSVKKEKIKEFEEKITECEEQKHLTNRYLAEIEDKKLNLDKIIFDFQSKKHELELKLAKNESQVDGLKDKIWEEFEISYIQAIDFKKVDFVMAQAVKAAREIKDRMKELGDVNIGAIAEYETVSERYTFLSDQKNDLLSAIKSLTDIIADIDSTIKERFKDTFDAIAFNFKSVFKELFGGGSAEIRLEKPEDLLNTGVEIIAQPPGKRLQNINLLSGGEKTLTAIALMFAVLKMKPAPFCILDEIEAALDDTNIMLFANYLKKFTNEIQFVLVTHQKTTMEFADVLYGVTMPEQGISKLISLKLGETNVIL